MPSWIDEAKQKAQDERQHVIAYREKQVQRFYETIRESRREIEEVMAEARRQGYLVSEGKETLRHLSIYEDWKVWSNSDCEEVRTHRVITWTITDQRTQKSLVVDLGVHNAYKMAQETLKIFPDLGPNPFKIDDTQPSTSGKQVKEEIISWLVKLQK